MKTNLRTLTLAACLCAGFTLSALAADEPAHDHSHGPKATPKGGRALEHTQPLAEVVVAPDRTVTINFYDDAMKPVATASQTVTVQADAPGGKAKLEFEKKGDSLVSKTKLPDGDGYTVAVQFRQTPDAKPQNFRFKLDLSTCGECKRAEYGCICGH